MAAKECLRFVPSRVEGLPDVTEVVVRPDRLELLSAGRWVRFRFARIARWPRPAWLWRALHFLRWRRRRLPVVADRDWFHRPPERFFAFYTQPRLVVYMPFDEPTGPHQSHFRQAQVVMASGGFHTFDLG
jgi:hypothetical protein